MRARALKQRLRILLLTGMMLFTFAALAVAAGEVLPRYVVSSGGGSLSNGGVTLQGSIGQPLVGAVSQGVTLCSGYHCGAGVPSIPGGGTEVVYLPLITR